MRNKHMQNIEICVSSAFFLATTGNKQPSNVAIASLSIDTDHGPVVVHDALVDTGGSKNLASGHLLLTDIRLAEPYGNEPIRMVTVNGLSFDYNHQGELHTPSSLSLVAGLQIPHHQGAGTIVEIEILAR
jgi:hypothetical protein